MIAFADQWLSAGDDRNSNAKLYGRTAAAGKFLSAVGPPGSKAQLAGKFAEIVGHAGPQAEKVLGPTARKTAYRYRGTEKTPDTRAGREYGQGSSRASCHCRLPSRARRSATPSIGEARWSVDSAQQALRVRRRAVRPPGTSGSRVVARC